MTSEPVLELAAGAETLSIDGPRVRVGFIVGPTAAGKSRIASLIAQRLGAEIVNADSRQVYRGMDIGTAKPGADERRRVPHHLIDICDPATPLDVAGFARLARATIVGIARRGRPVLVVGGSGLYLRAVSRGIFAAPPASPAIRLRLLSQVRQHRPGYLFECLREVDPEAAARIGPHDLKRLVRALEVHEQTGERISEHQRRHAFAERAFETLTVGLTPGRERLYQVIDERFDRMLEAGLVEEVRRLLENGCDPGAPPLSTIGYREIAGFLRGQMTLAEAAACAKRATRRLAKRQLTWFRADPEIIWLNPDTAGEAAAGLFQQFFDEGAR